MAGDSIGGNFNTAITAGLQALGAKKALPNNPQGLISTLTKSRPLPPLLAKGLNLTGTVAKSAVSIPKNLMGKLAYGGGLLSLGKHAWDWMKKD